MFGIPNRMKGNEDEFRCPEMICKQHMSVADLKTCFGSRQMTTEVA